MHDDAGNLAGFRQPDVCPGFTCIGRLIHTVAMTGRHAANRSLAGPDVDNVDIGFSDGNGTNGTDVEKIVGDILPGDACVLRLPDTAAGSAHVVEPVIARHTRYRGNAATAPGTYIPPFEPVEKIRVNRILSGRWN
jgi:hypothetical protein